MLDICVLCEYVFGIDTDHEEKMSRRPFRGGWAIVRPCKETQSEHSECGVMFQPLEELDVWISRSRADSAVKTDSLLARR